MARLSAVALLALAPTSFAFAQEAPEEFFESQIRPLLADNCLACHTKEAMGGLRMESREALLKGGDSGPAIVPGKPDESLLIQAVRHVREDLQMPMGGAKLSDSEIEKLVRWIQMDAPWPAAPEAKAAATAVGSEDERTSEEKDFWSFRPLAEPGVPTPANAAWARTDVDRFIRKKLEDEGLAPAPYRYSGRDFRLTDVHGNVVHEILEQRA